jgi:phosphodiesterase/alkaline phosphatase D-like protein
MEKRMDVVPEGLFPDGPLEEAAEIGAVTDRSVRLWLRQPNIDHIQVRLDVAGREPIVVEASVAPETDWTTAVELRSPEPAPEQPLSISTLGRRLTGRFAPSDGTHVDFTFGFGSCHHPFAADPDGQIHLADAARIYPAILDEMTAADARFLLLIGDQLYADAIPTISVRDNLPGDDDHPPPLDLAVEAYRRVTRGYFGESGFRRLRERFSTLCMWDDHDIFNDWGSRLNESSLDKLLFQAANRVYREYQHSRNPSNLTSGEAPPYTFFSQYGTAGFLALDLRGSRDFPEGRLLGRTQWEAFRTFLASEQAHALHTLFVVVSVPIAHVSRWFVELFQRLPSDYASQVRDRWCSRAFIKSRDEFLDELFTWQAAAPYRQAILLSGDVHAASAFTIRRRRDRAVIRQFTSSAFTTPLIGKERHLNRISTSAPNLFESDFRFRRQFLNLQNNYGLIRLKALRAGGHFVEYAVRAWDPARQMLVPGGKIATIPE